MSTTPRPTLARRLRRRWPAILVGGLVLMVVVAALVAATTSGVAFGLYNPDWDGTSEFRSAVADDPNVEGEVITNTARYADGDPNATVAVVVAPEEPYTGTDAERVAAFLEAGGTLLVLENFGATGNDLLEGVGAEARVDGRLLLDERHYETGPAMPVATTVTEHDRTTGVEQLSLNYASAVEPGNATTLVASSEYGYLGADPEDEPGDDAVLAPYPIATAEPVGNGTVVTVADPSVAINVMYGEPDNAQFLAAQYVDVDRVLFDASHGEPLPPLTAAVLALRASPLLQLVAGLAAVGAVTAISRRGLPVDRWARNRRDDPDGPGLTDDELAAVVRERHPEWDAERVRRVIVALNHRDPKRGDDE